MKLAERVSDIAGTDGFWKNSTETTFLEAADALDRVGLPDDKIIEILESLYTAMAGEYGE